MVSSLFRRVDRSRLIADLLGHVAGGAADAEVEQLTAAWPCIAGLDRREDTVLARLQVLLGFEFPQVGLDLPDNRLDYPVLVGGCHRGKGAGATQRLRGLTSRSAAIRGKVVQYFK